MTVVSRWIALTGLIGLAAGLAGCEAPPPATAAARADQARAAACQRHADEIYRQQNRAAIYLDDGASQSYSPFSSTYVEGNTSAGLPGAYEQQELVSDCIRNSDSAAAPQPATAATATTTAATTGTANSGSTVPRARAIQGVTPR